MSEKTSDKLLKIATVTAAHGIGGEVRLKIFLEDRTAFEGLGPFCKVDGSAVDPLTVRGKSKEQLIVRLQGVTTRTAAEALRGLNLYIPRTHLPALEGEDEFYVEDLVGLDVREGGAIIGTIKSIRDHGAGDLVEIAFLHGKSDYFAFTHANFPEIDLAQGQVSFVRPREVVSQDDEGQVH